MRGDLRDRGFSREEARKPRQPPDGAGRRSGERDRWEHPTPALDPRARTAYVDSDPTGNGRRLGEVALVDATSRIGQSGRMYYDTLMDENAAAHIAFGAGFGGTRTRGAAGLNRSTIHLDVMIGGPDFEVTAVTANARRVPLITGGLWTI